MEGQPTRIDLMQTSDGTMFHATIRFFRLRFLRLCFMPPSGSSAFGFSFSSSPFFGSVLFPPCLLGGCLKPPLPLPSAPSASEAAVDTGTVLLLQRGAILFFAVCRCDLPPQGTLEIGGYGWSGTPQYLQILVAEHWLLLGSLADAVDFINVGLGGRCDRLPTFSSRFSHVG